MPLNEFQEQFKDLMLDHPDVLNDPPKALVAYCEEGDIPLPARLKVYRNNIVGSLSDVMVATFPVIDNLVGREFLELMARSFILENPPDKACLSFYGEGFAEFIEGFELAKSLPYLPDVARFELALNHAYYAQDDEALSAEDLNSVALEALEDFELRLRKNVRLVHSRFPLTTIRDYCLAENQEGTLRIDGGGEMIMVSRPQLDTQTVLLAEDEFMMLSLLGEGKTLGTAVAGVLEAHDQFDLQAFLQKHIQLETFAAL